MENPDMLNFWFRGDDKMFRLIRQNERRDCGAAALAMISQFFGKNVAVPIIAEYIKVDQQGASIYGILDGAAKLQLEGCAYEGAIHEMIESFESGEISLPVIARIVNSFAYEHYVVIYKISSKWIYIADPGEGKYKLSYEKFADCFLGQIICFKKQSEYKKENINKKNGLREYAVEVLKSPKRIMGIWFLSLITTAIGLVSAFLYQYLVDYLLVDGVANNEMYIFAFLLVAAMLLYCVRFAVHIIRGKLLTKFNKHIQEILNMQYFDSLLNLNKEFYDNHSVGELIERNNDVEKVHEAVSQLFLGIMLDVVVVICTGCFLIKTNIMLALIVYLLVGCYLIVTLITRKPLEKYKKELMIQSGNMTSYNTETIHNMELIKSTNAQDKILDKLKEMFRSIHLLTVKLSMLSMSKDGLIELLYGVGSLLILWIAMKNMNVGMLTLGTFMSFSALTSYFMEPIQKIFVIQEVIQSGKLAAQRLQDVTKRSREDVGGESFSNGNIYVDNIQFRYGNRDIILDKLSFNIEKGEKIAIVGPSGCGKSTLLKLLVGFYEIERGYIYINEVNLQDINKKSLRENIGYLSQETELFADTIRNNLLFGNNRIIEDEEIISVLDACGCSFVFDSQFGLDTMLDEYGANLSGGQRQRLGIVRTLLRCPAILLLDEATSALDSKSEQKIIDYINSLDCTVIMCAHRLTTIQNCDQIIYMEEGTVLEVGRHNTLLSKKQKYAELWIAQGVV